MARGGKEPDPLVVGEKSIAILVRRVESGLYLLIIALGSRNYLEGDKFVR